MSFYSRIACQGLMFAFTLILTTSVALSASLKSLHSQNDYNPDKSIFADSLDSFITAADRVIYEYGLHKSSIKLNIDENYNKTVNVWFDSLEKRADDPVANECASTLRLNEIEEIWEAKRGSDMDVMIFAKITSVDHQKCPPFISHDLSVCFIHLACPQSTSVNPDNNKELIFKSSKCTVDHFWYLWQFVYVRD